ncbi:MAG TPA: hypothetical protein PLS24_03775, partial [Sedimentisphaerales bacterium]|nr:hypothetical protein [Sedimentisphaerales bacterium]
MVPHRHITRRNLLRATAAAAFGAVGFPHVVGSTALGGSGAVAPSERITLGCIGTGPQGTSVMRNFLAQKDCRAVAICDLKAPVRETTKKLVDEHYGNT